MRNSNLTKWFIISIVPLLFFLWNCHALTQRIFNWNIMGGDHGYLFLFNGLNVLAGDPIYYARGAQFAPAYFFAPVIYGYYQLTGTADNIVTDVFARLEDYAYAMNYMQFIFVSASLLLVGAVFLRCFGLVWPVVFGQVLIFTIPQNILNTGMVGGGSEVFLSLGLSCLLGSLLLVQVSLKPFPRKHLKLSAEAWLAIGYALVGACFSINYPSCLPILLIPFIALSTWRLRFAYVGLWAIVFFAFCLPQLSTIYEVVASMLVANSPLGSWVPATNSRDISEVSSYYWRGVKTLLTNPHAPTHNKPVISSLIRWIPMPSLIVFVLPLGLGFYCLVDSGRRSLATYFRSAVARTLTAYGATLLVYFLLVPFRPDWRYLLPLYGPSFAIGAYCYWRLNCNRVRQVLTCAMWIVLSFFLYLCLFQAKQYLEIIHTFAKNAQELNSQIAHDSHTSVIFDLGVPSQLSAASLANAWDGAKRAEKFLRQFPANHFVYVMKSGDFLPAGAHGRRASVYEAVGASSATLRFCFKKPYYDIFNWRSPNDLRCVQYNDFNAAAGEPYFTIEQVVALAFPFWRYRDSTLSERLLMPPVLNQATKSENDRLLAEMRVFLPASGTEPWCEFSTLPEERPVELCEYSLQASPADSLHPMPKTWVVEGSQDRLDWREIDRRDNEKEWSLGERRSYITQQQSRQKFLHYRFRFPGSGGGVDIDRLMLFVPPDDTYQRLYRDFQFLFRNSRSWIQFFEEDEKGFLKPFDYLYFLEAAHGYPYRYQLHADFPDSLNAYRLTCGPFDKDSTGRMPKAWELQACGDDGKWQTLETRSDEHAWANRTSRIYVLERTVPAGTKRLRFLFTQGWDPLILRIADINLLSLPAPKQFEGHSIDH